MKQKYLLGLHALLFIGLSILAITTPGTGGGGDSLTHYFFSVLAWEKPLYLLDMWAKPVFTLLSSPFAQLGFNGIEIFNIACGVTSSYFASLTAMETRKRWYWILPLLAFTSPAYYTYLFSGLTEPLASLMVILAVYLCLKRKIKAGFIIASFLPFIRTEAHIFLILFAAFGLFNKHFKQLPFLLTGYLVYGLIGLIVFENPLWVYEHPYNSAGSAYGSGNWYHYLERLWIMLAWPGALLGLLGLAKVIYDLWKGRISWSRELILIYATFFALLSAHSVVWALGIYGSAGLERTLLTVFPLLWIIMLSGLNVLIHWSEKLFIKQGYILPLAYFILQIGVSSTQPVSKWYYYTHLHATTDNLFFKDKVAPFIRENFPAVQKYVLADPYTAVPLGVNFKDEDRVGMWSLFHHPETLPKKTLFVFDSRVVPVHYGITEQEVNSSEYVEPVESWTSPEGTVYKVFVSSSYE